MKKSFQEAIENLSHNENFYVFLRWINYRKKDDIEQLREATTEQIQQLAGQILKAEDVLSEGGWESLRKKFMDYED